MPTLNTASDLLEVNFTDVELNSAMQLKESAFSQLYLQNLRVQRARMMLAMKFDDPEKDKEKFREHAYLTGQMEILDLLIDGIMNPHPIPINSNDENNLHPSSQQSSPDSE